MVCWEPPTRGAESSRRRVHSRWKGQRREGDRAFTWFLNHGDWSEGWVSVAFTQSKSWRWWSFELGIGFIDIVPRFLAIFWLFKTWCLLWNPKSWLYQLNSHQRQGYRRRTVLIPRSKSNQRYSYPSTLALKSGKKEKRKPIPLHNKPSISPPQLLLLLLLKTVSQPSYSPSPP